MSSLFRYFNCMSAFEDSEQSGRGGGMKCRLKCGILTFYKHRAWTSSSEPFACFFFVCVSSASLKSVIYIVLYTYLLGGIDKLTVVLAY